MRILQINKFFFLRGGTERYFFDLCDLLAEHQHKIIIWSTRHKNNFPWPEQDQFADFYDLAKREGIFKDLRKIKNIFWHKEAARKLEKVIKITRPQVAHLHNIFSHLSPSVILTLKKFQVPTVMTLHDWKLFCPNYLFFSRGNLCFDCLEKKHYRGCVAKRCLKNSLPESILGYLEARWQKDILRVADKIDAFIAPSRFMQEKALAWGISPSKLFRVPHFHSAIVWPNRPYDGRIDGTRNPYFLYFGRLNAEKGVDTLIEAFVKISRRFPRWRLKIAGEGPERPLLEKLAASSRAVEFLGFLKGEKLQTAVYNAYLTLVPSLCPETFSYSALESFCLARPVIASDRGALPELVRHKKTGLCFKPEDDQDLSAKMAWAVSNPKTVREMGEAARRVAKKKYAARQHYRAILKIYESISR